MATSSRSGRKTPAQPNDTQAAAPAAAPVAAPAPVDTARPGPAAARQAAAKKRAATPATAATSTRSAKAGAAGGTQARGKVAAKRSSPAASPAARPTRATAAPAKPAAAPPVTAQPAPVQQAAAKTVAADAVPAKKAAAKTAAAKKAAAKNAAPKTAAAKTPAVKTVAAKKAATRPPAPAKPAPVADLPAVAAATPTAPTAAAPAPAVVATVAVPVAAPARPSAPAPTPAPETAPAAPAKRGRHRPTRRADPQAEATAQAVLAVLAAPAEAPADAPAAAPAAAPAEAPAEAQAPAPVDTKAAPRRKPQAETAAAAAAAPAPAAEPAPAPPPTGPAHSQVLCLPGDQVQIAWQPGHACPAALRQAAQRRCDARGHLSPEDDGALPQLLRQAQEAGHELRVDEAVWAHLAAHRDARHRLSALEAAYPDGPASAALQQLLRAPLPLFQAEGALFAVVAGRALIADERGLGKGVQAIAAAQLWRRHFGVQRVLVLCAPAQRAAWQRAWQRFAGTPAADTQVVDGGHHQRQAQWSAAAGVRILSPEALHSDGAHLAHWAPDLVIVDEPQQLALHAADWAALQAPHALVLCGAALADEPVLMDSLVAWLDQDRLGPLAALRELHAASQGGHALDEADIERLTTGLSRLMLQRLRADVAEQLPPVVHSERLLPLAPGQRSLHDQHAALARRLLAGWQASGWCSDSDQWRLAQALRGMQQACHRADPADPASALAESTLQALAGALDDLAGTGAPRTAVLCASTADQAQLAQRLADQAGADKPVLLLAPGELLPAGVDVVLQVGVPWRPRRQPGGPRGDAPVGQQWLYLVAQDSVECGLFDTLASRLDAPRGPADGGARGYLQAEALQQWLQLLQAALAATPAAAA